MPCEITFLATHNHDLTSYDSLKFRKVSPEVRARLVDLFQNGHSPISALKVIKDDIQLNNENYEEMLVDRRYCPTYEDCYYLYKNRFRKKATSSNVEGKYAEYIKVLHKRDYSIGSNSDESSDTQDEDDLNENLGHEFEAYEDLMTVESDPDNYLMQNDTDNEEYLVKFEGDSEENFIQTDNEYKEFVIEISNDPEETIVQDENVVETIIVDKDITKFIPVSNDREAAKSVLYDINNIIDDFIEKSPTETRVGLEALYKTLVNIKDPSAFTTCCTVFGSVMQFKPITRKTTLSDANGLEEDSSRKILNGTIKKPIVGHNRSKERRKAALLLNNSGLL
ncbi:unnamed protein product [Diabrotica balteata]|uniref:Uncharacterized protein n=1 Tax=Diabrotica balteata TaxID=107213 RepID=A0A9P0DW34_DIABA|nr:unnamed protein product [Diabrotica balteata]